MFWAGTFEFGDSNHSPRPAFCRLCLVTACLVVWLLQSMERELARMRSEEKSVREHMLAEAMMKRAEEEHAKFIQEVCCTPCRPVTLSPCHPIALSPCHPVTQLLFHPVVLSPCRPHTAAWSGYFASVR